MIYGRILRNKYIQFFFFFLRSAPSSAHRCLSTNRFQFFFHFELDQSDDFRYINKPIYKQCILYVIIYARVFVMDDDRHRVIGSCLVVMYIKQKMPLTLSHIILVVFIPRRHISSGRQQVNRQFMYIQPADGLLCIVSPMMADGK